MMARCWIVLLLFAACGDREPVTNERGLPGACRIYERRISQLTCAELRQSLAAQLAEATATWRTSGDGERFSSMCIRALDALKQAASDCR